LEGANVKIGGIARSLSRLDLASIHTAALAGAAETMANAVREALSQPPGSEHRFPWRETGSLVDSIEAAAEGDSAIVGSTDAAAVDQEYGTAKIQPQPFMAPIAAEHAQSAVEMIGAAVADAIRNAG
jgi:hypothetical protein